VKKLDPNSPAAKFGIKVGDVIRKFDGEEMWGTPQESGERLQKKRPGQVVRIEGYRPGSLPADLLFPWRPDSKTYITIDVTLGTHSVGK
jgi:S1-C subfamily serine protease